MNNPTDAEVMQLAETIAYRTGQAAAMYKYAVEAHQAGDVKRAELVIKNIPDEYQAYLQDLHNAGRS